MQSLAVKYRPQTFDEVVAQSATKVILQQQLESGEIMNAYLFCGPAGCGKTTCARIFANEINKGLGNPIELDAASNNSVDDVREIIQQAKTASMDSEYKVFIMDEVHALSNNAWQAMLKILEEPPKKSIFILCTTDPQKIPKTILSRVQRYDFQRISYLSIVDRLGVVYLSEGHDTLSDGSGNAIGYIAKLAQGGMRDALTMLDKCLAYSDTLTLENVLKALGIANYECMTTLLGAYFDEDIQTRLKVINDVYMSGYDLKQFMKQFTDFVLDICKYACGCSFTYLNIPNTSDMKAFVEEIVKNGDIENSTLLGDLIKLNAEIKWDTNPKSRLEAWCITKE